MIQDDPNSAVVRSAKARGVSRASGVIAGCRIALKVVPGSRKDEVVGAYGDRLKVKVSAPPEDGRANAAVCALIAERLGLAARDVEVVAGASNPEKVLQVRGIGAAEARARLGV